MTALEGPFEFRPENEGAERSSLFDARSFALASMLRHYAEQASSHIYENQAEILREAADQLEGVKHSNTGLTEDQAREYWGRDAHRSFDAFLYEPELRGRVNDARRIVDSAAQLAFRILWSSRRPANKMIAGIAVRDELLRLVGVMRASR